MLLENPKVEYGQHSKGLLGFAKPSLNLVQVTIILSTFVLDKEEEWRHKGAVEERTEGQEESTAAFLPPSLPSVVLSHHKILDDTGNIRKIPPFKH